ncbi:hypothetical protein RintRC_3387 [Richelia intracellularis]|nr:hypothetical protein RintRC_3387 [Richelia intracellularis]
MKAFPFTYKVYYLIYQHNVKSEMNFDIKMQQFIDFLA